MKYPFEPKARIAEALTAYGRRAMRVVYPLTDATNAQADAVIHHLRASGWIIVRHDAIRLAQAHARDEAKYQSANDNAPSRKASA